MEDEPNHAKCCQVMHYALWVSANSQFVNIQFSLIFHLLTLDSNAQNVCLSN